MMLRKKTSRLLTTCAVVALGLAAAVPMTGCIAPGALLYENTVRPLQATQHKIGEKRGEVCSQSYLGLIAFGDGGLAAAAKQGGIREVSTVDFHYTNVVGIYQERCTVVTGH